VTHPLEPGETVLGIDPGTERCGFVLYRACATLARDEILRAEVATPQALEELIWNASYSRVVVEMPDAMGMPCSRALIRTAWIVGRISVVIEPIECVELTRREIKLALCGSARANDAAIRARLIDLYGPPGTKRAPGRTYGIKGDAWAALAVAATWVAKQRGEA
jgi:Holliday junction resolvasome RuvABC endonuclease subunit